MGSFAGTVFSAPVACGRLCARCAASRSPRLISVMREYSYQATDASIEALRHLKSPWVSIAADEHRIAITTTDGVDVLLSAERAEVEDVLEVIRVRADVVSSDDSHVPAAQHLPVEDLGRGRNDVVLFAGETWAIEAPPAGENVATRQQAQFTGRPGQRPPDAVIVCTTTDSLVVAASSGEGMLIRLGVRPMTLEVVRDRVEIARFLVRRGYAEDDPR